jgi:hypothetical protein
MQTDLMTYGNPNTAGERQLCDFETSFRHYSLNHGRHAMAAAPLTRI